MFCIHCGASNKDRARFCSSCGQQMQAPTISETSVPISNMPAPTNKPNALVPSQPYILSDTSQAEPNATPPPSPAVGILGILFQIVMFAVQFVLFMVRLIFDMIFMLFRIFF